MARLQKLIGELSAVFFDGNLVGNVAGILQDVSWTHKIKAEQIRPYFRSMFARRFATQQISRAKFVLQTCHHEGISLAPQTYTQGEMWMKYGEKVSILFKQLWPHLADICSYVCLVCGGGGSWHVSLMKQENVSDTLNKPQVSWDIKQTLDYPVPPKQENTSN